MVWYPEKLCQLGEVKNISIYLTNYGKYYNIAVLMASLRVTILTYNANITPFLRGRSIGIGKPIVTFDRFSKYRINTPKYCYL